MSLKFVGLHAHSHFSIGDAIGTPEEHFNFVIKNAGEDSMGLALSDHGNSNGFGYILDAKNKFKKKGIPFKPIYGNELYIHPDLDQWKIDKEKAKLEKEEGDSDLVVENEEESKSKWYDPVRRRHHLVVLVQNYEGYQNLCKIVSHSFKEGFYRFPRVDFKTLEKYNKGLIISHACIAGLGSWIILRDIDKGKEEVFKSLDREFKPLLDIFGKERAYLEIQFNALPEQKIVNEIFQEYSKLSGYKTIAAADSHYNDPKLWREREIYRLLARQSKGFKASEEDIPKTIDELKCELYPKSGDQMWDAYKMYQPDLDESFVRDAITRTFDIAHDFIEDFEIDGRPKLPTSFIKKQDPFEELRLLCFTSLIERNLDENQEYVDRLNYELSVIQKKDFALYFLVLREALEQMKKEMLLGAGRGSGAGSLVCYLLGITLIDPIKHGLLFERFLSENRKEPPDIDNDCEDRDDALKILRRHFGEENVIAISNFNTFQLKSLVKDVSKLYGIPFQEVNAVTSVMEQEAKQKILDEVGGDQKLAVFSYEAALRHSPTFAEFIKKHPYLGTTCELLFRQNKAIGRHAGGVVITENADAHVPLIKIRGEIQTPFTEGLTAKHLEPFGLIKYDFLGISTIRVIRKCIERVVEKMGQESTFKNVLNFYNNHLHPDVIGEGDLDVFEGVYHAGRFCATFQFSQDGVQKLCMQAKPTSINDIAVITSLFRPGPLKGGADKMYLRNREENFDYYNHPIITEILGPTNNILCIKYDQEVLLANGERKLIKDIAPGDDVITGEGNVGKVLNKIQRGVKQTIKLNTNGPDYANTLSCTPDHKIRTVEGYMEAEKASHILRYRYKSHSNDVEIEHPYIMGLCVGDGCLNQSSPAITCGTEEVARVVSLALGEAFNLESKYYRHCRAWYATVSRNAGQYKNPFISWLRKYDLYRKSKSEKKTPEILLRAKHEDIQRYLAGYIDADGRIAKDIVSFSCGYASGRDLISKLLDILKISHYHCGHLIVVRDIERFKELIFPFCKIKANNNLPAERFVGKVQVPTSFVRSLIDTARGAESIKSFCGTTGIHPDVYHKRRKSYNISTLLKIAPDENDFIENFFRGNFEIQNIRNFDREGVNEVYDLSIEHDDHSFIANGYAVHNCYQEQFMLLAHKLAGFTLNESDELRKLLVKPLTSMAEQMKQKRKEAGERFIAGCIKNGLEEDKAIKLWEEDILGFISYGFNKSHAYAYSYLSYQCAYLFHHHPDEWVCSVLENEPDRDAAIAEVESVGYTIGKPDILRSGKRWAISGKTLIPSFATLKGFGDAAVNEIIEIRERWERPESDSMDKEHFKEIFESFFYDLVEVQQKKGTKIKKVWKFSKFNKRALEALIKCEALDSLNIVGTLFENYAHLHRALIENWSKREQQKFDILAAADAADREDWADSEKVEFQSELLGTFDKDLLLTEDEIENLMHAEVYPIAYITPGDPVSCWFLLQDFKKAKTKTDKEYYKLTIADMEGNTKRLNYFGFVKEEFKKNAIYAADFVQNGEWLNVKGIIMRIK